MSGDKDTYQGWSKSTLMAFPYFGGKVQYSGKIIEQIPVHERYIEPFSGAASVLLNKPESHVEVLNDKNEHVVTFFRVLRNRRDELVEYLNATPYSRSVCERWESLFYGNGEDLADALDDVALAGRWFALRHMRFAGRMSRHGGFSAPGEKNEARDLRKNIQALDAVRERLQNVVLECGDYCEVLERYDEPTDFAYVDPPYVGNEEDYGLGGFDHGRLVATLDEWPGRWILSYRGTSGSARRGGLPRRGIRCDQPSSDNRRQKGNRAARDELRPGSNSHIPRSINRAADARGGRR